MLIPLTVIAQKGYDIKVILENNPDSVYYLARYQGNKTYITDTSFSFTGQAHFTGQEPLQSGIYLLASSEKVRMIEFIVGHEQHFEIHIKRLKDSIHYETKNSVENELFFKTLHLNSAIGKSASILNELKNAEALPELIAVEEQKLDSLKTSHERLNNEIVINHPDWLITKILLAMTEVVVPDSLMHDQYEAYSYYKARYWDHYDFTDTRLLSTPILPNKLRNYFEQLVTPVADTVIKEIEKILQLAQNQDEIMDFLIWHFTSEYQNPKYMGLDKVFVHLADQYYAIGSISNVDETVREKVIERADQLRNLLIGSTPPDLVLTDTSNNFVSYKNIDNQFTVLFFWDHTCGFCKSELLKLKTLYEHNQFELEVFAINTNNDFEGWKTYIRKHNLNWINVNGTRSMTSDFHHLFDIYSTPVLYLLDKDKTILAKRIEVSQLELLLNEISETGSTD